MVDTDRIQLDLRQEETKDWHETVTTEFRKRMVKNLVEAMSSVANPFSSQEQYYEALMTNARIIESEKFYKSDSRADYYHLIAKSIYESHQAAEKLEKWQNSTELPGHFQATLQLEEDESSAGSD